MECRERGDNIKLVIRKRQSVGGGNKKIYVWTVFLRDLYHRGVFVRSNHIKTTFYKFSRGNPCATTQIQCMRIFRFGERMKICIHLYGITTTRCIIFVAQNTKVV